MSLDVYLTKTKVVDVYEANITHNLTKMAGAVGIYEYLWRPEEVGVSRASQLIVPLQDALVRLKAEPDRFKEFNPENGWGSYDDFIPWLERYLEACKNDPDAFVSVFR